MTKKKTPMKMKRLDETNIESAEDSVLEMKVREPLKTGDGSIVIAGELSEAPLEEVKESLAPTTRTSDGVILSSPPEDLDTLEVEVSEVEVKEEMKEVSYEDWAKFQKTSFDRREKGKLDR